MTTLSTMFRGGPSLLLSEADQHQLSLWISKTTLTLSLTVPDLNPKPPASHFRTLYEERRPHPAVRIRVAHFMGERWGAWFRFEPIHFSGPGVTGDTPNGYAATTAIGHAIFQSFAYSGPEETLVQGDVSPAGRGFIVQLWPIRGGPKRWPPLYPLDDEGLDELAQFAPLKIRNTTEPQ